MGSDIVSCGIMVAGTHNLRNSEGTVWLAISRTGPGRTTRMASIIFAERISRGGASDVLILLFSATVKCSEVLSQNDRWTDYAAIPNCPLSVRPNRVLYGCGASTFQFKFTVEKIP